MSRTAINRVFILVLDSLGVGELPDADEYGDRGSSTLGNMARALGGVSLPNLGSLGIGNILPVLGVPPVSKTEGFFGRMAEKSSGKDTTTGHWEMMGLTLDHAFPTYPEGFPVEVIDKFETGIGRKTLGNYAASGTVIIEELGEEHMLTGRPIVYTSADSVFQIAAHEEIIPVPELYAYCETARQILRGDHSVGRVIARPFIGNPGSFSRTPRRHDFSLAPVGPTLLDLLSKAGIPVYGVGKIGDIFTGRGITESHPTTGNEAGMDKVLELAALVPGGLVFVNFVDFDMLYGHRNDISGYAEALTAIDQWLPKLLLQMKDNDLVVLTADHGCDPTTLSTDHSREYVPLMLYSKTWGIDGANRRNLGTRESFGDLALTLCDLFALPDAGRATLSGTSFTDVLGVAGVRL